MLFHINFYSSFRVFSLFYFFFNKQFAVTWWFSFAFSEDILEYVHPCCTDIMTHEAYTVCTPHLPYKCVVSIGGGNLIKYQGPHWKTTLSNLVTIATHHVDTMGICEKKTVLYQMSWPDRVKNNVSLYTHFKVTASNACC